MSLIELILNDRRLLLATGAALVPLGLAVLLWLAVHVHRFTQARAARRAADDDARFLAEHRLLASPEDQEGLGEAHLATAAGQPPAVAAPHPAGLVEEDGEEEEVAPEGDGDVANSAMQELLNSVFSDEDYTNRLEHLMDELDDIRAADLASLCDYIARHLS